MQEGLGQALEQRRLAVAAQRLAVAAQQAASRDPLTGLANRLGLEQASGELLPTAASRGRVPWLVLVDIDHFKEINDTAGHPAGDAVLREVSRLLRRECRSGDLVARWAGDEFVILLTSSNTDTERRTDAGPILAERIRTAVGRHRWSVMLDIGDGPTVSIGVARGRGTLDMLFADADAALYRAKRAGWDRVEVQHREAEPADG
jgi:two-component system cell cycle response regulator